MAAREGLTIPNLPQSFDFTRFTLTKENATEWARQFGVALSRQWTQLTQALNAVWKISLASERPSTPFLDEAAWYESDTGRVFFASSGAWVVLNGFTGATTSTSSSYTMLATDAIVLVNATGGNRVVTVNNGSTYTSRIRAVKKTDTSANTVTITPSSGTIDGAATFVVTNNQDGVLFTSDGTDLHIISRRGF